MDEKIEENLEKKTVKKKVTRWKWTCPCPDCEKTIEGPTEKKVRTNAIQHYTTKHARGGG